MAEHKQKHLPTWPNGKTYKLFGACFDYCESKMDSH